MTLPELRVLLNHHERAVADETLRVKLIHWRPNARRLTPKLMHDQGRFVHVSVKETFSSLPRPNTKAPTQPRQPLALAGFGNGSVRVK